MFVFYGGEVDFPIELGKVARRSRDEKGASPAEGKGFRPLIRGRHTKYARGWPSAAEQANLKTFKLKQVIHCHFVAKKKTNKLFVYLSFFLLAERRGLGLAFSK